MAIARHLVRAHLWVVVPLICTKSGTSFGTATLAHAGFQRQERESRVACNLPNWIGPFERVSGVHAGTAHPPADLSLTKEKGEMNR